MGCDQQITNENTEEKNVLSRKTNEENNSKHKKSKENNKMEQSHKPSNLEKKENIIISKKGRIKEGENKSVSKKDETKEGENQLTSKNEETEKNTLPKKEETKKGENKDLSNPFEKKDKNEQLNSNNNKIIIEKSENISMDMFIRFIYMFPDDDDDEYEDDPLYQYNYFKIDFTICNYMFITPEPLIKIFSSVYSKVLKDATIFFPKDFQQAKELLIDYETEVGNKENWIIISPCEELENNIKSFHENKNIYYFIGYCPMTSHKHNLEFFYKFNKYYGIVDTYGDLIVKLFKLNNIFYYRKKQKYGINNNINEIFELKYDTKFKFDFNNECSKNSVIYYKYFELYNYKMSQEKLYFLFIQSLTFLNKYLEKENYDILFNYLQKLSETFIFSDDEREKVIKASKFLKNLHILYLYFSNYPYLYGALTDEEIDKALSSYKPNTLNLSLVIIYNSFFNSLVNVVDVLASKVNKGISILNDKKNLNNLHKLLICINLSKDQIEGKYIIYDIIQFYQIKYYLKDIDFCLGKTILNVFEHLSKDYPLKSQIINTYLNKDKRFLLYLEYNTQIIRQKQNQIEDEKTKAYNKSIKYNHTIVLGDKKFHNLINKMKLPCENIYYLNENEFSNFFSDPKKIDGKYKICKYFIIMNEKNGKEYFETIRYMSNVFGIKLAVIIYIENKDIIINKKILENPLIHIVLAFCEKDILNYYYDSFIRLKDITLVCDNERELISKKFGFKYDLPKLNETKIIREEDNGWDMVKDINTNFFNLIKVYQTVGLIDATSFNIDMYRVYKENNCLDLFLNYYGNYFWGEYLPEQFATTLCMIKLFLYAYTLEEDNNKSFYSIMNNDFRSGDFKKNKSIFTNNF